jgi:antitoxin component YwqK of YwqJK toxin-antitoxin module
MKTPTLILLFLLLLSTSFLSTSWAQSSAVERKYRNGNLKESYTQDADELLQGPYTAWFRNGQVYAQGTLKDSKEDGTWQYFYKNGNPAFTLSFLDGKLQGKAIYYYFTGELQEERLFEADIQVGTYQSYYPSGALKRSGKLVDGVFDGPLTTYNEDGTVRKVKLCDCEKRRKVKAKKLTE